MTKTPPRALDPQARIVADREARNFKSKGPIYPGAIVQLRPGRDVLESVPDDLVDTDKVILSTGLVTWGPLVADVSNAHVPRVEANGVVHRVPVATLDRHRPRCSRGFVAAVIARIDFLLSTAELRAWVPGSNVLSAEQVLASQDTIYDEFRMNCRDLLTREVMPDLELRMSLAENMNNTKFNAASARRLQAALVLLSLESAPSAHDAPPHADALTVDRQGAAKLLGISLRKLDELVAGRRIPFKRVGRRVVFAKASLADWVGKQSAR